MSATRTMAPLAVVVVLMCSSAPIALARVLPVHHEGEFEKPWFYHDLEGPTYEVVSHPGNKFEERHYDKGVWVSTNVESISYSIGTSKGFKRLFDYISGANHKNVTIPMTVPVKVAIQSGAGPFCTDTFKVSFYVPSYLHGDVPKPDSKDLFVETTPKQTVYISSYGGYALDGVVVYKAKAAIAGLKDLDITVDEANIQTAGYDAPFRLLGRHNEIWLPAVSSNDRSTEA